MFAAFKNLLRRLFMRGGLLRWWVGRRSRQWEKAYCAELGCHSAAPIAPVAAPKISSPTGQLGQILLIADCMWEQNQLVPELSRLAETRVLDLRSLLKKAPANRPLAATVTGAVRNLAISDVKAAPDVILLYARSGLLSDEVFHVLRQRWKCPLLGMNMDDKQTFFPYGIFRSGDDNYLHWAGKFDLNLTNCLPATEWYRQRGLPCLYLPPGFHRPAGLAGPSSADFKYDLSFIGSVKLERKLIIERLQQAGVKIHLFGAGWPDTRWVDDANAVFRSTKLNLGIGFASPSQTLTMVKGRDFECPGAGACYLTTYNWELPLHYELGTEILCYRSVEELIEMYSYYRKRPEECLKIAQAAWRRCAAEHTWEQRFRKIFRETGFKS